MRTAAYLRYSSENQRAASLEDQARNIRQHCARMGWADPALYSDAAISGARDDRPGYRSLLADASAGRFDVLLVDDLSRLSRDSAEATKTLRRLTFHGIRLIGVSDGTDTARDGHELDTGIRAVIGEHYLRDLAKKTHRGLTGRALDGASAGGLPYGYRVTDTGRREIDPEQADVVRRIYGAFAAGHSPRSIAGQLNAEHVPSARGGVWAMSAIYGDGKRGIGILANPIYIGRQVWNRSKWIKHPDTGRRSRIERPEADWIITDHPELAIVSQDQWAAAQQRLKATRNRSQQQKASGRGAGGRTPKTLLSGVLRCADCGGPMVIVGRAVYGCGRARDQGVCKNSLRIPQAAAERSLLAGIKRELLSEDAFRAFERDLRQALKGSAPDSGALKKRLADAEKVKANLMAALRAGIITPSTKAELLAAEAECEAAQRAIDQMRGHQPATLIPRAREVWERMVSSLETLSHTPEAREAIRELIGESVVVTRQAGQLIAEIPGDGLQLSVVAGAGFVRWLQPTIRIPIS